MRLLTWNIWFGQHMFAERTAALIREITRRRPDVVALQEVTPPVLNELEGSLAGYTLHGGDSPFGYDVVLLTRVPVRATSSVNLPSAMGRRLLFVRLGSGLVVATVHLESTAACSRERAAQLAMIGPLLSDAEDVCLVGDMNFDDSATVEPAALDTGFVDVWPTLRRELGYTVDSVINTMRADLAGGVRKRLDRVFLRSSRLRASAIELVGTAPIDDDGTFVSDHFGLVVELDSVA